MVAEAGELYGPGARRLQDTFDSRRLADRLVEVTVSEGLDERAKGFVRAASYFYLATVDPDGFPDVSYKGGRPGFVRVVDDRTLRFPSYDGNGMFRSLGNIVDTARVALLFIRQDERPARIRVHGTACVLTDTASCELFVGADAVVEVAIGRAFVNCPRYVHDLTSGELSPFAPAPDYEPPAPEWKTLDTFADVLPDRDGR
ncbi:MAG: pyridoxamine 5'-phosphate oxidase family protein [Acidimicrobiia bacterium]|nr:pyridoxamine 5'-phosphate oxidase family protein [Acidimicrobiia bacterium]